MEFLDEKKMKMKTLDKEKVENLDGTDFGSYKFEEFRFCNEGILIKIPENFIDMPDEIRNIKYPCIKRPEIIKTDKSNNINITITKIESAIMDDDIEKLLESTEKIIKRQNIQNAIYDKNVIDVNGKKIACMEFKTSGMDDFIYNHMFFFEYDGITIMGNFICPFNEHDEWKDIGKHIVRSLRVLEVD